MMEQNAVEEVVDIGDERYNQFLNIISEVYQINQNINQIINKIIKSSHI